MYKIEIVTCKITIKKYAYTIRQQYTQFLFYRINQSKKKGGILHVGKKMS